MNIIMHIFYNWGLGIGDWGLGIWGLGPYPKPQTPKPKTQNPNPNKILLNLFF